MLLDEKRKDLLERQETVRLHSVQLGGLEGRKQDIAVNSWGSLERRMLSESGPDLIY